MNDNFAQKYLPSIENQPIYAFENLPQFQHPEKLNCVEKLLDNHIQEGRGDAICLRTFEETWTYLQLYEKSNQIAHYL
ncbi:MAG: 2-aminobenzoate-CoA ligase, partial [Flavobacterium sp.]